MLARARRERRCLLVGVIDLDGFKSINDTYGHLIGDRFLQASAQRLGAGLRGTDMLGRLGGDEFLLLAPGPEFPDTVEDSILQTGEPLLAVSRLEQRLSEVSRGDYRLSDQLTLPYRGASAGVVALNPHGLTAEDALNLADSRMYEVKRARKQAH